HLPRGSRIEIVGEHHAVSDEHIVFERDSIAEKRMTLDHAVTPDDGAACDLDERPDERVIADLAPEHVDELGCENANVLPQLDVGIDHDARTSAPGSRGSATGGRAAAAAVCFVPLTTMTPPNAPRPSRLKKRSVTRRQRSAASGESGARRCGGTKKCSATSL